MFLTSKLWQGQTHYLDKMNLKELVRAYFAFPAIQTYIVLTFVSLGLTVYLMESLVPVFLAFLVVPFVYALAWFLLHRYVLHGKYLYKTAGTAKLWKRIHFDHHQDPNDLGVLFGALPTTLPTIVWISAPVGWIIAGPAGATASLACGLITTCVYEFCHCIQHLAYQPKLKIIKRMKKLHLAHHFHNENGNYGIIDFFWDRVLGTYYGNTDEIPRSETVFNLGYTAEERERFPWVGELSGPEKRAFKNSQDDASAVTQSG